MGWEAFEGGRIDVLQRKKVSGGGHGNQGLLRRKMEKWKKMELWTGFLPGMSKEELWVGNRRERRTLSGRSGL